MWHEPLPRQPLIQLEAVSERFDGRLILPPSDLTLYSGDFMTVTGPNGGGKTTLLRLMLGLLRPTSGRVTYLDQGKRVSRLHIGYMPQKSSIDPKFPITVGEVVRSGLLTPPGHRCPANCREGRREATEAVMEYFGLTDLQERLLSALSGGQIQRTLLARAFVSRPDVLMLDEPLSYLDATYEKTLCDLLADLRGLATIVIVSHQTNGILELANRHIEVNHKLITS